MLRAIDVPPSNREDRSVSETYWNERVVDEIENECSRNDGKIDPNKHLWKDLLDTLEPVPLRAAPLVGGSVVTAEIPRLFVDYYE